MIIGDVRGKGLEAVEVAADIIGRFRELAHSVHTLDEIAYRLDAGLTRRWGKHEEFVTALLAQVDPERGRLTILNAGHPPPILVSAAGEVTVLEVRAPAPAARPDHARQRLGREAGLPVRAQRPAAALHRRRHRGPRREPGVLPARRAGGRPRPADAAQAGQDAEIPARGRPAARAPRSHPARPGPRRPAAARRLAAARRRGDAAGPRPGRLAGGRRKRRRPPRDCRGRTPALETLENRRSYAFSGGFDGSNRSRSFSHPYSGVLSG